MKQIMTKIKHQLKWAKCSSCNEEWNYKVLKDGLCPRCRGLLPQIAISEAMELITNKYNELEQQGYDIQDIILILSEFIKQNNLMEDKSKLLKCNFCDNYDLTMNIINGQYMCDMCYAIIMTHNN